jgi:hypothetical protein
MTSLQNLPTSNILSFLPIQVPMTQPFNPDPANNPVFTSYFMSLSKKIDIYSS